VAKGKKDAAKASKSGGKKGKKFGGGAKKSRIPQPVQGRAFAWIGLLALGSIALLMLNGTLTLEAAALRAGIVLVALMVLERVVAPIVWTIMSSEGRQGDNSADTTGNEVPSPEQTSA
jgi:hypothetical protein